jgi:hypothetical protein
MRDPICLGIYKGRGVHYLEAELSVMELTFQNLSEADVWVGYVDMDVDLGKHVLWLLTSKGESYELRTDNGLKILTKNFAVLSFDKDAKVLVTAKID